MKTRLKSVVRRAGHAALGPLEARLLERHGGAHPWPHVFIVGAPRSGTSLFYELLVTRYSFAFFTNLAHRFWKTPVAANSLGRKRIAGRKSAYRSDYGHIAGWWAPNEGGWIWQRWLADGPWTDETSADALAVAEMRATLAAMSGVHEAPFVNKNVMHSNRLRLLDAVFPGALFLEVRRDARETARSIIRAQRRDKGPAGAAWWSVRPSNAKEGDLLDRACRQVTGVSEDIARDAAHLGRDCLFSVDYTALCADPGAVLEGVASFLSQRGVPTAPRAKVPDRFEPPFSQPLAVEEEARLDAAFAGSSSRPAVPEAEAEAKASAGRG